MSSSDPNVNPYQSPPMESQAIGVRSGRREDLRSVALYQKGILVCILIYILLFIGRFLVPAEFQFLLAIGLAPLGIAATIFVFLLAIKVYETGLGIVFGILTLVPCIGLIVLLMINAKATSILKQNGIPVGLLGADMSKL